MEVKDKEKMLDMLSGKGDRCNVCKSYNLNFAYQGTPIPLKKSKNGKFRKYHIKRCSCQDCGHDFYLFEEVIE